MDPIAVFPDATIKTGGVISNHFLERNIKAFLEACRFVHHMPYGYNADRDDLMSLFAEAMGSCTTKHAVIATLAEELALAVHKNIGIYPMTEEIVSGTDAILEKYKLPYLPMVHCFLVYGPHQVDLTEGNDNGKNRPIDKFLHTEKVIPNIPAKDEYLKYRDALKAKVLKRTEFEGIQIKAVLQAREEGIRLLRNKIGA